MTEIMNKQIPRAIAKDEIERINTFLKEPHLLIGGLAVEQYVASRDSKDIDIICSFEESLRIIKLLFPTKDWRVEEPNKDDYRPSYELTNLQENYVVYLGVKISERDAYTHLDWVELKQTGKCYKGKNGIELKNIIIPNVTQLAFSKFLSFLSERRKDTKAAQDLEDFCDLTNNQEFNLNSFYSLLKRTKQSESLIEQFHEKSKGFDLTLRTSCIYDISTLFRGKAIEQKTKRSFYKKLEYPGDMLSELVTLFKLSQNKIILNITYKERKIVFDLFICILFAKLKNVQIDVHYHPIIENESSPFSILMFKQLGCNVKEYPIGKAPNGVSFIADPDDDTYSRMVIKEDDPEKNGVYAYVYEGYEHNVLIKSFAHFIEKLPRENFSLELIKIEKEDILKSMESIVIYKDKGAKFDLLEVTPNETFPQSDNKLREYKLKQIELLEQIYKRNDFKLFEPTAVVLKNNIKHLILPPVLENLGERLHIAEGHTRLFSNLNKAGKILCIVVTNLPYELKLGTTTWEKIEFTNDITSKKHPDENARYIERDTHFTWGVSEIH